MKNYIAFVLFLSFVFVGVTTANMDTAQAATNQRCVVIMKNLAIGSTDAKTGNAVSTLQNFLRTQGFFERASTGFLVQ